MRGSFSRMSAVTAISLLVLSACAGGSNGIPSGGLGTQVPPSSVNDDAKTINLSGEYSGTDHDSIHGTGKASASLAGYKSALGGALGITGTSATADIAWTVSGTTVAGTSVIVVPSGYCSFSMSSTYNTKSFILSGKYHAVHGCTGETGNYKLKHRCIYTSGKEDVRSESSPRSC
ncbi:MAG: hypothetical protein WCC84_12215 [Candidatus Cybelea sp.]